MSTPKKLTWYICSKICKCKYKSVARRLRRTKADWIGCCHVTVQGVKLLAQRYSLNLNFSFLNRISLLLISCNYSTVLTSGPRSRPMVWIKIPDLAGNRTRGASIEGSDCQLHNGDGCSKIYKCKSMTGRLRRAKADWIGCCHMTVQELAQRYSLNFNFSFLNQISLLLISSRCLIVLTRLSGPRSRHKVEIKIPDSAGNRTRAAGNEGTLCQQRHGGGLF